jgi:hypothetical protein
MVTPLWIGRPRRQENQPASTLYHTTNSHATAPHIYTRPPHAFSPFSPSLFLLIEISSPCRSLFCHSSLPHRDFVTMPVTLLSLTVELILSVGENLRDAHNRPCRQYRDHSYGDFNAFLQVNSKFHEILNPILRKEAAECPRNTTGRVFAHLIRTNNLKSLKSFLALGANRESPPRAFGTINPKQDSTNDVFTPLVAAAFLDNVQLVRILLDSGAKVQHDRYNHEDLSCYCAMHAARSEEMVHVLMEYGGDIELVDSEKWTPLHWFSCRS